MTSTAASVPMSTWTRAQRIIEVLDRLGIERAHFAGALIPDWIDLVSVYPERISSLTLICPELIDAAKLEPVAEKTLIITGDQPPAGERVLQSLSQMPAVHSLALEGYSNALWNDPITDCYDPIMAGLFAFLKATQARARTIGSDSSIGLSGDIADITFQMQGCGEALVLLPLGLSASQWNRIRPALNEQYCTILLGGPQLGVLPLLEHRGQAPGYQRLLRNMLYALRLKGSETILDVGSGSGVVDRWLARYTDGQNPIVGVDVNPYLVHEAELLAKREGLESIVQFRESNAENLSFATNSFDVVISSTVMEEVDADKMLTELIRVAKPAGRIGVIVRARDLPYFSGLELSPGVKTKAEAGFPGGVGKFGCADKSLYRRFHQIGLQDVQALPDLTVFSNMHGVVEAGLQRRILANLTSDEAAEWRAAADNAARSGMFFLTWPHHCAVGTKPE